MFERGFKSWCERVAVSHRRELSLAPADPLDARRLASHLGVLVWTANEVPGLDRKFLTVLLKDDPDSWSAVTLCTGSKDVIILNSVHSEGRTASDIMHELAHIILGHEPARVEVSKDGFLILSTFDRAQEEEAKWLSGCLLLPREALLLIRRTGLSPQAAAARYGVSVPMLTFRQNVMNLARPHR